MAPLNRAERRKAFLRFLVFFLITVAVIVAAVLSSVQVPFKENDRLRKERDIVLHRADNEIRFLQSFEKTMQETMNLLDTVNLVSNVHIVENRINNNIGKMTAMVNDSMTVTGISRKILDNLATLHQAKKQVRDMNSSKSELEMKDREIDKLRSEVELYKARVIELLSR